MAARLKLLLQNPTLELFPVFLIRNPKGQISSSLRKGKSDLRTLVDRYVDVSQRIYDSIKDRPYLVIRYERLVRGPERVLGELMQRLEVPFHPNSSTGRGRKSIIWAAMLCAGGLRANFGWMTSGGATSTDCKN